VSGGVAELQVLSFGEAESEGGFGTGDVEVLDVDGLIGLGEGERWGGEGEFGVVDGIFLLEAEGGCGEVEASVGRGPVKANLVAPGGFGFGLPMVVGSE